MNTETIEIDGYTVTIAQDEHAWDGDVYGIASIHPPGTVDEDGDEVEGEEIPHGSVWGFYGRDHEKSGLLESARDSIACHKAAKERAEKAAEAWEKRVSFIARNMTSAQTGKNVPPVNKHKQKSNHENRTQTNPRRWRRINDRNRLDTRRKKARYRPFPAAR